MSDGFLKKQTLFWALVSAMCLAIILGVMLPEKARLQRVRARTSALISECRDIERDNRRLADGLARLQMGDPVIWERLIRDRLGWVWPNEVPIGNTGNG